MTSDKKCLGAFFSGVLAAAIAAAPGARAIAMTTDDMTAGDGAADEILVTADRSGAPLSEAPVFAIGIGGGALVDSGIFTVDALYDRLPNLTFGADFTSRTNPVGCRGLTLLPNGPAPCAFVVDGVQVIDARLTPLDLFGIDDAVFTTGPHGAYYANALAGAVVINTARPGDAFAAEGLVRGGNGGLFRAQGGVSGPVADGLGLRLDGFYETDGGRIENTFLNENVDFVDGNYGLRLRGVYAPSDRVEIDLQGRYVFFNQGTAAYSFVTENDFDAVPPPTSNRLGRSRGEEIGATLAARVDLGAVDLLSISGFSHLNERNRQDLDYSNGLENPFGAFGEGGSAGASSQNIDSFTQELRLSLSEPASGILNAADIGAVYTHVDIEFPATFRVDDGSLDRAAFFSPANPAPVLFAQEREDTTEIWAAYASASFSLTDRLSLDAALRVEGQRVETREALSGFSAEETVVSTPYDVTLSYQAGPYLLFAGVGSATRGPVPNSAGLPFGAEETARTAEGGVKAGLMGGRLNVSATGFCMRVEDYQIFTLVDAAQFVVNFDRVRICGAEGAFDFAAGDRLSLYGNFGAVDTTIRDAGPRPDLEGNETPNTIRTTFNLGGAFRQPIGGGVDLVATLDASRQGRRVWNAENTAVEDPAFFLNARAGVAFGGVELAGFVSNATDTDYTENTLGFENTGRPNALSVVGRPRRYGVELRGRF